jgi:transcriptional regulator with XRE-family HTH domain
MKAIGIKLKSLRRKYNLKQEDLADKLCCSIATYCKLETGVVDITYSRLEKLAVIYNINLYELFLITDEHRDELKEMLNEKKIKISNLSQEVISLQRKLILLHQEIRSY